MIQNAKMLKAKAKSDEPDQRADHRVHRRSRLTALSDPSFWETLFLSLKVLNSKKLEPVVIGLSWVQLERVNPRPFPTHAARESEWAKAKDVLSYGNLVFERNQVDS
ncbi:hypothetical protein H5410_046113, partial [Solanum commersonii]